MDFSDLDTSLKVTLQNVTLYSNWLYNNREEILRAQNRSNYITSRIGFVESNRGAIISFLKKTGLSSTGVLVVVKFSATSNCTLTFVPTTAFTESWNIFKYLVERMVAAN